MTRNHHRLGDQIKRQSETNFSNKTVALNQGQQTLTSLSLGRRKSRLNKSKIDVLSPVSQTRKMLVRPNNTKTCLGGGSNVVIEQEFAGE